MRLYNATYDVERHRLLCIGHRMLLVLKNTLRHQLHARTGGPTPPRVHAFILSQARDRLLALDVSKLIRSSSVLHTACYITCAIPTTTVTRVGPPLRQRYIASKHPTCKHTSKRSISRSLALVLITVQLVVYHKR